MLHSDATFWPFSRFIHIQREQNRSQMWDCHIVPYVKVTCISPSSSCTLQPALCPHIQCAVLGESWLKARSSWTSAVIHWPVHQIQLSMEETNLLPLLPSKVGPGTCNGFQALFLLFFFPFLMICFSYSKFLPGSFPSFLFLDSVTSPFFPMHIPFRGSSSSALYFDWSWARHELCCWFSLSVSSCFFPILRHIDIPALLFIVYLLLENICLLSRLEKSEIGARLLTRWRLLYFCSSRCFSSFFQLCHFGLWDVNTLRGTDMLDVQVGYLHV